MFADLAGPPFRPPLRPRATAYGFLRFRATFSCCFVMCLSYVSALECQEPQVDIYVSGHVKRGHMNHMIQGKERRSFFRHLAEFRQNRGPVAHLGRRGYMFAETLECAPSESTSCASIRPYSCFVGGILNFTPFALIS